MSTLIKITIKEHEQPGADVEVVFFYSLLESNWIKVRKDDCWFKITQWRVGHGKENGMKTPR